MSSRSATPPPSPAIVEQAHASDDVTTLVSAALFAPDSTDLLRPRRRGRDDDARPPGRRDRRRPRRRRRRPRRRPRPRPPHRPPDQRPGRLDHRPHPSQHDHPRGPDVSHSTSTATGRSAIERARLTQIVPSVVALAPDRPRLPALRLDRAPRRGTRRLGALRRAQRRHHRRGDRRRAMGAAPPPRRRHQLDPGDRRRARRRARRRRRGRLLSHRHHVARRHGRGHRSRRRHRPRRRPSATAGACSAGARATAALLALGWTVTTAGGIDVSQQWVVFGAYGCFTARLPAEHRHRRVRAGRRR